MLEKDTTADSGVSDDSDNPSDVSDQPPSRLDALDALAQANHQKVLAEVEEARTGGLVDSDSEATGDDQDILDNGTSDTDDDQDILDNGTSDTDDPMVSVKVDGVDTEVALSQLKADYQKGVSGDQRLAQAAAERTEVEAMQQELRDQIKAIQQQTEVKEAPKPTVDDGFQQAEIDALAGAVDDLSVGTDAEKQAAANTIRKLVGGPSSKPPVENPETTQQIVSQATQQATAQMQYDMAKARFTTEHDDLASDPTLTEMVMISLNEVAPQSATYDEAFGKAAVKVRRWRDGMIAKVKPAVADTLEQGRAQAKQQLQPEIKSAKTTAVKPEETPETQADIIQQMRASRGQ